MDPLDRFAQRARERAIEPASAPRTPSLAAALRAKRGIVAEIKPASPTEGKLRDVADAAALARAFHDAGARGLSALAEPTEFAGSARLVADVARAGAPTLWKDFVVTHAQLDAAARAGASAVLLILPLLSRHHGEFDSPAAAIAASRARGLDVLLEVYDEAGYDEAQRLAPDLVGLNNRDLRRADLRVDPALTRRVLAARGVGPAAVVALSGAKDAHDVRAQLDAGAAGVLVGTTLMRSPDPAATLRELLGDLA